MCPDPYPPTTYTCFIITTRPPPSPMVTTAAGTGTGYAMSWADGYALSAELYYPYTVAADSANNIYFTEGHRLRVLHTSNNTVKLVAGATTGYRNGAATPTARLNDPHGIAVAPNGDIYIADL